jgi:small conductance mechanosensitive channel
MDEVERVVKRAVEDLPDRDEGREIEVLFEEFGDSSINFSVLIWLSNSDQMSYRKARSAGMKAIKGALDEAGLTIPFPIRTLDFGAKVVGGVRMDDLRREDTGEEKDPTRT